MQRKTSLPNPSFPTSVALTLVGLTLFLLAPATASTASGGLGAIIPHYDQIRQALAADSLQKVAAPAAALRATAKQMAAGLSAESAGVPAAKLDEVKALLPEVIGAARALETVSDLQTARDHFYALSTSLVRWREAAGDGPAVLYCTMAKRSWLQPDDQKVGNPYLGKEMSACGQILSE